MRNETTLHTIIVLSLILFSSLTSHASQVKSVTFQDTYETGEGSLKIRGTGLLRYMVLIKAYVGVLYLPENVSSNEALSDVPKRLEVEYFQHIKGEAFGPATRKLIAANVDDETFAKLKEKIEHHATFYEDVKPGDRYSLTYLPGIGTELALNGIPKGTIEGADFAAALFAIWLGPRPMDESFKSQILGLK